jgi:hypothetical protein
VTSFINYWIEQNGRAAFRLLLSDLKGLGDRDPGPALRSVSGQPLAEWIRRWQTHLRKLELAAAQQNPRADAPAPDMRSVRLGDLLLSGQHFPAAAHYFDVARQQAPAASALRFRASQAELAQGHVEAARERLGSATDMDGPHAGWFALRGRFEAEAGDAVAAARDSSMALSLDPWSELVACEGHLRGLLGADPWKLPDPSDPARQRLCAVARARPPVQ